MFLLPYHVDVPRRQVPVANFVLVGVIVLVSFGAWSGAFTTSGLYHSMGQLNESHPFLLTDWSPAGLIGSIFIHAGVVHLIGNMVFLWLFGNAVCAKIGNLMYPVVFLVLGLASGAAHLVMSDVPALGASGAINGVVGIFLILFPLNDVRCVFAGWIVVPIARTFSISSVWMILLWVGWDLLGAALGGGAVAYWAHLGGFAGGVAIGLVGWSTGLITMRETERSLPALLTGQASTGAGDASGGLTPQERAELRVRRRL